MATQPVPESFVAESRIARLATVAGGLLIALALTVLSGWIFRIPSFLSILPGLATMKANTATAFLLTGLALLRRRHRDFLLYCMGVLAIALLTLGEYLSAVNFGIDQLLVSDPYSRTAPGRMSLVTCIGFTLLGVALSLANVRSANGRRLSRGFGMLAGLLGGIALLGYTYDVQALYQVPPYSSIAVHTAIAFVIATVGILCAHPGEGVVRHFYADDAGSAMLRQLLPAALLIPYVLGLAIWTGHRRLGWGSGFSLSLVVAGTVLCLVVVMVLSARRLERKALELRETDRALAERTTSLQAQENLLKIFVKHVPAAVAMVARDMCYLQVSDRWCADYSLDSSQMLGRSHYEIFPDIPERWKQIHRRGLAGETLRAEEDRWDRDDGTTTWLRWEIRPWGSRDGVPEGILIFSEDITPRKQVEEKLRETEATTRALLETAAQAIIAVDATGTIVVANRMAAQMFGYAQDELLGQSLEILIPVRLREGHVAHRAEFAANPRTRPMGIGLELLGRRKDGTEFPIEVSLSSVPTRHGLLAVSFVSEITARKQAESALRTSEQQLRVLAGTLLTAQEDERRRLSRELHDDITQRLAFLSIALGKLVTEMPDSFAPARDTLRALQQETSRASTEVRRLSHGLHPSAIEDLGLSTALQEYCEEFEKAQGVHVRFTGFDEDLHLDLTCSTILYRITQESVRNAVKHGRATEVQVALSKAPGALQLRVQDNGAGFTTESARTKSGLGVVSMRERIRLVNGTLTVSSRPGQGTEVVALVPCPETGSE